MSIDSAPAVFLPWDTDFFGRRIARVVGHRMTPESAAAVDAWCAQNGIAAAYFLADADDFTTTHSAESHGWHQTDIRVSFVTQTAVQPVDGLPMRRHQDSDVEALKQIAAHSYTDSRFYYDPRFPRADCDRLYATWAEKSGAGWADAVFIAELDARPAGFITLHLRDDNTGDIGLVGVAESARGRGLGKALVVQGTAWAFSQGVDAVTVVTQGRNIAAQRLYQRAGFVTQQVQLWYHKWYIDP